MTTQTAHLKPRVLNFLEQFREPMVVACHRRLPHFYLCLSLFFVSLTLALSPLGFWLDTNFFGGLITRESPGYNLVKNGLDTLASQRVAGTIVIVTGLVFTLLHRRALPLLIALLAEGLFYTTALVKIFLGKNSPAVGGPYYWDGGYADYGRQGMALPSGHATEAVLLYGTVVLLITMFAGTLFSLEEVRKPMRALWALLVTNTVVVSWLLGFHWPTDLLCGLFFGLILLRVLKWSLESGWLPAIANGLELLLVNIYGGLLALKRSLLRLNL